MSLTGMLDDKNSPISRVMSEHLPGLATWRAAYLAQLPVEPALRPEWEGQVGPVPYSTIGHAIDTRLRLALTSEAVEATLLTGVCRHTTDALVSDGLLRKPGALDEVGSLLVHGVVLSFPATSEQVSAGRRHVGAAACHLLAEVAELATAVQPWRGTALLLDDTIEEQLCRVAYVTGWLEECARTGRMFPGSALEALIGASITATDVQATARTLLQMVPGPVVTDLKAMLALAEHHGVWPQLRQSERIDLGPTFAGSALVGGADADVICDGMLIDVKATVDPRRAKPQDLRQLLGYALLDFDDRYKIDSLGLFLARHGRLISWTVAEVLEMLGSSLHEMSELRERVRAELLMARHSARARA